jgi:hypothetical protein
VSATAVAFGAGAGAGVASTFGAAAGAAAPASAFGVVSTLAADVAAPGSAFGTADGVGSACTDGAELWPAGLELDPAFVPPEVAPDVSEALTAAEEAVDWSVPGTSLMSWTSRVAVAADVCRFEGDRGRLRTTSAAQPMFFGYDLGDDG